MIIAIIQDRNSKKDKNKSNESLNDSIDFIKEEDNNSDINNRISNVDEYVKNKFGMN